MDGGPAPMLASLGEDEESDGKIFEAKFTGPHLWGWAERRGGRKKEIHMET